MACKFPLSRFTMHSHRKRINSFWARPNKVAFVFAGKQWEHLESRQILFVHRPKFLIALNVRGYKILTEQIHCLCNNVIYPLSAASTNDQINKGPKGTNITSRYQSTSSEPRPNCVLRVVNCITSRGVLKRTI